MLLLTGYFTHTRRIRSHTHTHTHTHTQLLPTCVRRNRHMYVWHAKRCNTLPYVCQTNLAGLHWIALLQEHSRLWFQIGEHRPLPSQIYTFLHTHFCCHVVQIPTKPQIAAYWFQKCYNLSLPGSGTWTVGNVKRHWRAPISVWLSVVTAGRWL